MAIGRITGPMLFDNLERQGVNLAFDANLAYLDVSNRRVGISTTNPQYSLDSPGNVRLANILILGNTISSNVGQVNFGAVSNLRLTGGNAFDILYTDGAGHLAFSSISTLAGLEGFTGNNIIVGTTSYSNDGNGTNALTTGMTIADAINLLDNILGNITNKSGNVVTTGNLFYTGGSANYILSTNGAGITTWIDANTNPAIVSINSNAASTNANIFAANTHIQTLDANLGTATTNITTLFSNAASQAISINSINANIGAYDTWANANLSTQSTNITTLFANAATQSTAIDLLNANVATANAFISSTSTLLANVAGNTIVLGANTTQALVSNAVTLTQTTKVTDAIAQLNYVLGKLVPPSPPNFPNNTTISLSTATTTGLMTTGWSQTDNTGWGNASVTASTSVSAVRSAVFTTSAVANVGPGSTGTVTAYVNGIPNGNVTLTGSNSNTTNGNLYVYNVQDYHAVVSSVTAGFWTVFSTYATATGGIPSGWNRANIYDAGTGTGTNTITWYYDASSAGTPTFSNTSAAVTGNSVTYSSTIPHYNSSATFRLKGNVANLSGDLYLASPFSVSAGGAFATPTTPTYSSFVPTISTPLTRNYSTSSYFETPVNITTGFGSSTSGPSITFSNPYASASSGAITPTGTPTVLYKTGTTTQIEETAITNSYTGATSAYRIVNPDGGAGSDTPAYTGSEATFNSQTSVLLNTDATVVAAKLQYDVTNYSSGSYWPYGPNLSSGRSATQYFTFKWTKAAVSKFNITYSGTIAGLWVALPGSVIDTTAAPTNGWINMATAYAGSGVPGTGTGGNGSNGCSTGGAAVLNSLVTGGSYTCTFGTASSTNSTGNEIYIRVKLTSGQSLTALSIANPTN